MGDFGFGQKIGSMGNPKLNFLFEVLRNYSWRMGVYAESPRLTVLHLETIVSLLTYRTKLGTEWQKWSNKFASTILETPRSRSKGRFEVILDSKDPSTGKPPLQQELLADAIFLMLAGSDTSATAMSAIFFYLVENAVQYTRLITEIRDRFSDVEDIHSGSALASCTYLTACIEESMRMSPPAPRAIWREVDHGGTAIDGKYIPAGYDVG
ncbi:MAG: hypothetical protein Q9194_005593, partial [Teloschistes cf. exilis]